MCVRVCGHIYIYVCMCVHAYIMYIHILRDIYVKFIHEHAMDNETEFFLQKFLTDDIKTCNIFILIYVSSVVENVDNCFICLVIFKKNEK